MSPTRADPVSRLQRLWLTEAIRLREAHAGPLDDAEANRRARQCGDGLESRVIVRALHLAERDGQLAALNHWLQGARLALALLAVLALTSGVGLGVAALGDGTRPVNVFWALGSLLGLHLLTLLGWLAGLALAGRDSLLGRLWLWLSERFARDARAAHLGPALMVLLQRRRLARWGLGALVHGLWSLALLAALLTLLTLLATRRYGFVWETTLLGSDTFVLLTQALGALPAVLGFPVPDAAAIRASGVGALAFEAVRQAWAGWLVGVTVVYGLLPRLLLAAFCLWRWRHGQARLALDLDDPDYALLRARLQPDSERLGVTDPAPAASPGTSPPLPTGAGDGALLVGIELTDRAWPPELPSGVTDAGVLDSREQRTRLLDQLGRFPPARLAIACDPRRSPDRGTLALVAELAHQASEARVWLLPAPPGEALDGARLGDWHQALDRLGLQHADSAPLDWLENGHD